MRRPFGFFLVSGVAAMLAALLVYSAFNKREAAIQRAMVQKVRIAFLYRRFIASQDKSDSPL